MHRIRHGARIHHNLFPGHRTTGPAGAVPSHGDRGSRRPARGQAAVALPLVILAPRASTAASGPQPGKDSVPQQSCTHGILPASAAQCAVVPAEFRPADGECRFVYFEAYVNMSSGRGGGGSRARGGTRHGGARGTAGTRHGGVWGAAGRGGKFRWAPEVPGTEHGGRASHQYGLRELGPPARALSAGPREEGKHGC